MLLVSIMYLAALATSEVGKFVESPFSGTWIAKHGKTKEKLKNLPKKTFNSENKSNGV